MTNDQMRKSWTELISVWGVNRRDLMISKTGLKDAHFKHMHRNKCGGDSMMGEALVPLLRNWCSWVPL